MAPEGHGACPGQHNKDRQGLTKVIKLHLKMMRFLMPRLAIMVWSCKPCKKKNPLAVFGLFATTHIDGDNKEEQSNLYLITWAEEMPTPSEAEVPWKPHPNICRHLQHAHLAAAPSSAHLAFSSTQTSCFSNLLGQTQAAPRKAKGGAKGEG